jgi:alginate O-acetyltransferase complex protein AlgJ
MARRADILAQVAARLKARHIDLVVAIVPDKARVVAENMDGPRSAQATARLAQWISMLRSRGIMPVNIYDSVLKRPDRAALWWRTDTHWSQQGAKLGAQAIADAVVTKIDRSHHFVTTEEAVLSDAPGDMLRLMALDKLPDQFGIKLRPAIDRQHRAHTVEQQTGPSDGLLDAGPEIEVALMGTSFSLNANFAGYLEQALGAKVLNTAEFGGGFARSAAHYLNGRTFRETTPRLIIWEMSERVVGQPLNAEDSALAAWAEHAD